jgi:soluble lytic murein transglycosylase-like protein
MLYLLALAAFAQPVKAQPAPSNYAAYIEEAAQKSGLPIQVIRVVISTESAGNPRAVSPKGAMGLMQLMPATWQALRRQLNLGDDPFDPHDNIMAGALYLRALYDAYGAHGYLAAYNAGPRRWENHRDTGQPLPAETRAYVTTITQKLGSAVLMATPAMSQPTPQPWTAATLFLPNNDNNSEPNPQTVFAGSTTPFVSLPLSAPPPSQGEEQ